MEIDTLRVNRPIFIMELSPLAESNLVALTIIFDNSVTKMVVTETTDYVTWSPF